MLKHKISCDMVLKGRKLTSNTVLGWRFPGRSNHHLMLLKYPLLCAVFGLKLYSESIQHSSTFDIHRFPCDANDVRLSSGKVFKLRLERGPPGASF